MDRGILFKTELVRKLASKTETRRLVSPAPPANCDHAKQYGPGRWLWTAAGTGRWNSHMGRHHYGSSGDRLWVRETWTTSVAIDNYGAPYETVVFLADFDPPPADVKWKPGIHLRKADAKRWLTVCEVRPERLQQIDDAGARREGFANREDFLCAWDWINGGAPPAGSVFDPWVWVIRFTLGRR